jgi:hypothetical protein
MAGFQAAQLVLAEGCRRERLFEAIGGLVAAGARGGPRRLPALVSAVATSVTAVLSLDATVARADAGGLRHGVASAHEPAAVSVRALESTPAAAHRNRAAQSSTSGVPPGRRPASPRTCPAGRPCRDGVSEEGKLPDVTGGATPVGKQAPRSSPTGRLLRTNSGSAGRDRRSLTEGEASAPRRTGDALLPRTTTSTRDARPRRHRDAQCASWRRIACAIACASER